MSIVNKPAATSQVKKLGKGLKIDRIYTTAGVHPYDEVTWERRDVVQTNWKSGEVIFEQKGTEYQISGALTLQQSLLLNTSVVLWGTKTVSGLLSKLLIV